MAAANCDYFAGLTPMLKGETIPVEDGTFNYTIREPLGVVGRIIAYNHVSPHSQAVCTVLTHAHSQPLMFCGSKLAAPLAAGNTVVIKPPDQSPLSSLRIAELLGNVFPPGVLNIVTGGRECGQALTIHPLVKKITLIGSVPTGLAIQKAAADQLKPTLLELGGKKWVLSSH